MNIDDTADDGTRVMSMKPWQLLFAGTVVAQIPAMAFRCGLGYITALALEVALGLPVIPWLCVLVVVVRFRAIARDEGGRWMLGYMGLVVADVILGLPFGRLFYAVGLGIGPVVWSLAAFRQPGAGWWWHRKVGAREPTPEEKVDLRAAVAALGPAGLAIVGKLEFYVIDYPEPFAVSRGVAMVVSTGLLNTERSKGPLGHELEHLDSGDAVLSQALDRLTPWDVLLRFSEEDYQRAGSVKRFAMEARSWFLRIAGGRAMLEWAPLAALWAKDFRRREEAADRRVIAMGLAPDLADFLEEYDEPREIPNPRGLFDYRHHPPTKTRISALREGARAKAAAERAKAGERKRV